MSIESSTGTMECSYHHTEWWEKDTIASYYPEKSNKYSGEICWVKDVDKNVTLIAESCSNFRERLKRTTSEEQ
jgi:hypothetical protein